jgi:hypothetical protein
MIPKVHGSDYFRTEYLPGFIQLKTILKDKCKKSGAEDQAA